MKGKVSSKKVFFALICRDRVLDLAQKTRSELLGPSLHMAQAVCDHASYTMCITSKALMLPVGYSRSLLGSKAEKYLEVQGIELGTYMQKLSCTLLSALSICFQSRGCRQLLTSQSLFYVLI